MAKKIVIIVLSLLTVIGLCLINASFINTRQLYVREEILNTSKVSDEVLIAYFTDLHYGKYINNDDLDKVVKIINDFDPDIIIFGGDLIDNYTSQGTSVENKEYLVEALKSLDSKYGKYAIYGEDDTNEEIINIYNEANFKLLDNSNVTIKIDNDFINIIGINSLPEKVNNYSESFNNVNLFNYSFVIAHHPDIFNNLLTNDFDYMLSGHSHGGQIYIPIISLFNREYGCEEYYRGKTTKNTKTLDISNGVGRSDNNARFLADAEIVMYRLTPIKTN